MISDTLTPPAEACSPDADRDGPAVPENIARLLYVVRVLLESGRHLVATIERRAARPGFSLFAALFGTARLPVILAHLHRGILRAAALESLLLRRAASGRDVEVAPLRTRSAPSENSKVHPVDAPFDPQVERLTAERAQYDAPIDPDHLPTAEEIEAEVRSRPFGRTIAAICRDFGVVPGLCTREFWDALMVAIACHEGSAAKCWQDMQRKSEQYRQEQENVSQSEQMERGGSLYPHQMLGFKIGDCPDDPFRDAPVLVPRRHDVPAPEDNAAAAEATGPPPRAAMNLAA